MVFLRRLRPRYRSGRIRDAIDDADPVVRYQQRAVGRGGKPHGTSVHKLFAGIGNEAGKERHGICGRLAVFEGDESDLIPGAAGAIPGAMFGNEGTAIVAGRELLAAVEGELQRGDMRTQQDVWDGGLCDESGILWLHAGIHIAADVAIGPAVKAAVFDAGEVVRRKIVANASPARASQQLEFSMEHVCLVV